MTPPSQSASSTNWKPGSALSKFHQISSETRKVSTVVAERDVADVARRAALVAADEQDERRADQRQEGDDGEDRPVVISAAPANIIQVTRAATPISMAKA